MEKFAEDGDFEEFVEDILLIRDSRPEQGCHYLSDCIRALEQLELICVTNAKARRPFLVYTPFFVHYG